MKAIWSPHTGIVDWGAVTNAFGREFVAKGGILMLESEVTGFYPNAENQKSGHPLEYPVKISRKNKVIKSN